MLPELHAESLEQGGVEGYTLLQPLQQRAELVDRAMHGTIRRRLRVEHREDRARISSARRAGHGSDLLLEGSGQEQSSVLHLGTMG